MALLHYTEGLTLESGIHLSHLDIAYTTYGHFTAGTSKVVWICHALTADSDPAEWWKGLVGEDYLINPDTYFIVCANILGSCYGTTGPLSNNPATGNPYYSDFPAYTIRDMVRAHQILCRHLGIQEIYLLAGGSMGGYQALEWCMMEPELIKRVFLIATSPAESAWGIAIHTAQRLAIEADPGWKEHHAAAGANGLKAARAIGMLTYRDYAAFLASQSDPDTEKTDGFRAESYIIYQGEKLVRRFHAYSYWLLTKAMDSHQLARGRNVTPEQALQLIRQPVLVIGITSDMLCPLREQRYMKEHIPDAKLIEIDSLFGHDGFLIETAQISHHLGEWLRNN
ncbi:homoserine O-acetyltransferase family protein [Rurimicrobium arvi]|uniref:Homoserine O-acetyltransferase n=1 Tax=Rurimicrobium arvi TaxID=2049916 RepID=A0ABP8MWZ5_9BACT